MYIVDSLCVSLSLHPSLQVNNVDFANIIREEAVLFLLDLPKGEEVSILAQKKKDGERKGGEEEKEERTWGRDIVDVVSRSYL